MLNIKNLLVVALLALLSQGAFAQETPSDTPPATTSTVVPTTSLQWANRDMTYRGKNYDVLDSAYYPKFRRKQFKKFMDHQEVFPPKPRNQWEIGGGLGLYNVIGNIPTLMLWQKGGGGLNVNVRKAWGYIFSTRLQYIYGVAKNLDRQPTESYDAPYTGYYTPLQYATTTNPAQPVYRASRMESSQLSLDLMFNTHNIRFHRDRNELSLYGYAGIGALGYKTRINALNSVYQPYNFSTIVPDPSASNKTIRKELQKAMDNSYESPADNGGGSHILDNKTLDFAPSLGAGASYKLNKKFNLQLEERYTFPADGYLDGARYGKPLGDVVTTGRQSEAISYLSLGVNYNLSTKKKSVEPLWWMNPLDWAYGELSYPRHMILPNPVLPDEDGDGITDQFDKCPKTPAGIAVDSHGCPLDTDGDGVPDYKDKQLITPTECQPVDADGVGKCPCPDGCKDIINNTDMHNHGDDPHRCGTIGSDKLLFSSSSDHISTAIQAQLAVLAAQMQANPNCKVAIIGGGSGSKVKEQHSWLHVNAVIEYMSEKNGISRDRFLFKYGEEGDENIVTYRSANEGEQGPSVVSPPHPEIK